MTIEEFAAECMNRQMEYITTERERFFTARSQVISGDVPTDPSLSRHHNSSPVTLAEIDSRIMQLNGMQIDATVTFAANHPSIIAAFSLHFSKPNTDAQSEIRC